MAELDIRNTSTTRTPEDVPARGNQWRWWAEENPELRARKITAVAGQLWKQLEPVRNTMLKCSRLYGNAPIAGLGPRSYRATGGATRWNRICLNVAKAVADTYVSMVTKDRPKVSFQTQGATHDVQERSKNCELFVDGIFYENDLHELDNQLILDTAEYPLSVEHWFADTWTDPKSPKIVCERRLPWELLVDEAACQYGTLPREIYLVKTADRWGLIEEYREKAPEIAKALETAQCGEFDEGGYSSVSGSERLSDLVTIVEAYRRPRTKTSGDGLHCIVVGDVMLNVDSQKFARLSFPVELNWRLRPTTGVYGSSLVDEIAGIQRELNVLLQKIQRSHHLCAVPHLMVEESSQVNTNAIDNQTASMIRYRGTAPIPLQYSGVTADVYQHLWNLRDAAFSIIGVNAMNAQGQLPPGVKSGRAMRTLADVTTQRFQPSYRQFQGLYLRRARQVISLAREISETHKDFATRATGKSMMAAVKWADANLDDEAFILKLYPTNALADDPAEKIEQVSEIQGLPASMKRLLDFPDLKSEADYEQANYDLVMRMGDEIIKNGTFYGPEPYMNLDPKDPDGAIKWMGRILLRARMDMVPDERLRMLSSWLEQANQLWTDAQPAPAPAAPDAMGPGAPPAPPPMTGQPPMAQAA